MTPEPSNPAPAEDIGRRILGEDVTQEELSDAVIWPKASVAEPLRDQLLQLCSQRLDAFRMQRGEELGCLLTQKPAASGTGAATAPRSAARSKSECSPVPTLLPAAARQHRYCELRWLPAWPDWHVVNNLLTLPLAQRLELVQTLWDSIAAEQIGPELTESERELIDHRLERFLADGDAGLDADEVLNALEQML